MAADSNIATRVFEVSEEVSVRLQELSAAQAVSLSTALAAATAALLHRYSCEGTLTVRITDVGRSESRVRLLPVNLVIPDDTTFEQMLQRARQVLPDHPEAESDEWWESNRVEILMPPEIQNQLVRRRSGSEQNETDGLGVAFTKACRGLRGTLTYRAGALEESCITRMAEHLETLLGEMAATPAVRISRLNILGNQEKRQILNDWNDTGCEYPQCPVPELVDRQVQRTPHAVALIQGDQTLTYTQLNEEANRLANHLRKRGVGPETLVGLCMEQSLRTVVAIMGILKAGGAYVPLDPSYPQARLEEMALDSNLTIAVTSARFRHLVPAGLESICLDRDSAKIAAQSSTAPVTGNTPDSAAYVMYTSASTGKPKGVVGIHRSISNGLKAVSYRSDEVCCLNTFLSFGFSIANLFLPLMSGVPLVVLSDEQIRDTNQMIAVLEKEGVTRLILVPSILRQILDPAFGAASRLKKITTIGVAGAKLSPSDFERLTETLPQARLHNRYSSTEIGTVAAIGNVTEESHSNGEITIGRPVANTRIYILDRYRNPLPAGMVGELYVGAAHLARGYLNRPDLTQERFIPDPFRGDSGQRLFRTGDLGRFTSNGEIELLGRADEQVKINGFRIDLPEVERALWSHIGVREAVTAVREVGHRPRLVAYVVSKPIGTPSAGQLRNYLQKRLPDYMVPSQFVFIKALPMLSNGKVDRQALPLPEPVRPNLETGYVAPRTEIETAIAQIWSDVLVLYPIGVHDDFHDLGGDSLSAAETTVRLQGRFGVEITPEMLLDRPTVAGLAAYLDPPRPVGGMPLTSAEAALLN